MKWIKRMTLILFALILIVPMVLFNFQEGVVSEIDNRTLSENPFLTLEKGNLVERLQNYISDRIGLRDEMILSYTLLNDRLFGEMIHPNYCYGTEGYVFGAGLSQISFSDYHVQFADMMLAVQNYCQERGIPFVMAFEPAKPAVLQSYLPEGLNYDRSWVDALLSLLDEYGVNYVDNTGYLTQLQSEGTVVFNQKYDANHWNALGAWYGVNHILEKLQEELPLIHLTTQEELTISSELQTSLPVSQFPIREQVPKISVQTKTQYLGDAYYSELERDSQFRAFGYYYNEARALAGAPRALVFQGSYINSKGIPYMANAFGEYVYVHDYANILNLPYYINIFQPECVIFEVAEYTISDAYFSYEGMKAIDFNSALPEDLDVEALPAESLAENAIRAEQGQTLTKLVWSTEDNDGEAWLLCGGQVYDWIPCQDGFCVTLHTQTYLEYQDAFTVVVCDSSGRWKQMI